jgi:hypothetical protein
MRNAECGKQIMAQGLTLYLFFGVAVGFIPARKGLSVDSFAQYSKQYLSAHLSLLIPKSQKLEP